MSKTELNHIIEEGNKDKTSSSASFSYDNQKNRWEKSKLLIGKKLKQIIWKAWIEPLQFIKYKDTTLFLSAETELISSRARTQYYEDILIEAKKNFEDLSEIKILKFVSKQPENFSNNKGNSFPSKSNMENFSDLSFINTVSMKLNTKLTFGNFVVGHSNQLPYAASKRVCDTNSIIYNPLFIYGNVGMGKTHLLNSIALDLGKKYTDLKIVFMSAERFMYQFIKAIRLKDTLKFKDQFRSIDVLIIDDIQFIGGKDSTQEEFFYTFNDLINQGKQIIISSNKSPSELIDLDERLRSRLGGGLVVDFLPTNFNLRIDILNNKVNLLKLDIPYEVLEFLATKISSNVRELEGALNRVWANHELTGKKISIENSQELLSDILLVNEKKISINFIQEQVASYFNLKISDMTSSLRPINIARPRQISMYLCKQITSFSYPEIGKAFGGKDHTTVMHAVKKIESLLVTDLKLKKQLLDIRKVISSF